MKKQTFKIFTGYDHLNAKPLYQIIGINNDYCGEWNETRDEAHEEIKNLLN
jgi:hypothetical protein